MTNEKKWKILFHAIMITIFLVVGFYFGRTSIKDTEPDVKIEYLPGETIVDSFYIEKPYKVTEPIDTLNIIQQCIKDGIYEELWPSKIITEYIEIDKTDTSAIIKDWATKRTYNEMLFDNTEIGKCSFKAEIQYNRMRQMEYDFTPVNKIITETHHDIRLISPFVGISYLTTPWVEQKNHVIQINGGIFIKEKYGIQAMYQRGFVDKNDYVGGGFLFKF
jgi:hypothetical protein